MDRRRIHLVLRRPDAVAGGLDRGSGLARAHGQLAGFQEEAPGMVFWHPKGWTIYTQLQHYVREMQKQAGYREVNTPEVVDRKLWEKSGHWDKYRENMFITEIVLPV